MANYSALKSSINNLIVENNRLTGEIGKALANYIAKGGATVSEKDIYTLIKDLPQELQVQVLIKALASKEMVKAPSYLERKSSGGRGII